MVREMNVNGIACRFKSSAAVPRMYRIKFGRDLFQDLNMLRKQLEKNEKSKKFEGNAETNLDQEENISEFPPKMLEVFENVAYIMHKHGDKSQPEDIDEWLEQFETFDIYEILPAILEMWNSENKTLSVPKKKNGR